MNVIEGIFIKNLPIQEGDSRRGHWVRGGFVVEYGDEYPRKVAFSTFGEERVMISNKIPSGTRVQVKFSPESREFEGRWYTELRCINISPYQPYPAN